MKYGLMKWEGSENKQEAIFKKERKKERKKEKAK